MDHDRNVLDFQDSNLRGLFVELSFLENYAYLVLRAREEQAKM